MGNLSSFLWWGGMLLLACLLYRMVRIGLSTRYPAFSAYVAAVLAESVVLLFFRVGTREYWVGYWVSEFITAALSFGIVWDGYNEVLAPYAGARRMARSLLGVLFVAIGAKTGVGLFGSVRDLTSTITVFERDLRVLQALALLAFAGLVVHYAIPVGRNVLFLLFGYGLYLGVRVGTLNILFDVRPSYVPWVNLLLQSAWNVTVVIWCVGMWSSVPTWSPEAPHECNYERASRQTMRALGELRDYVVDSWRSS
jgi:hypothetical protein